MGIEYQSGVDLDELHSQQTPADLVKEANAFRTLPAGRYRIGPADQVTVRRADDQAPIPGRLEARIQAPAEGIGFTARGKVFFTVSPERHTRPGRNGGAPQLDSAARLWGQAIKAWDLGGASVKEQFEAFGTYPIDAFVTAPYKTVDGKYVTATTEAEVEELVAGGAEQQNFVQSLTKCR